MEEVTVRISRCGSKHWFGKGHYNVGAVDQCNRRHDIGMRRILVNSYNSGAAIDEIAGARTGDPHKIVTGIAELRITDAKRRTRSTCHRRSDTAFVPLIGD